MLNMPLIQNQLLRPLESKVSGLEITYSSWDLWTRWVKVRWDIIIGHSLGGDAALELTSYVKTNYCITLDPRHMSNLSWLDAIGYAWQKNFTAPNDKCFNFYRGPFSLFMPGYPVDGAQNVKVSGTHLDVPGQPEVMKCIMGLVNPPPAKVA